jgi:hypothetical protein
MQWDLIPRLKVATEIAFANAGIALFRDPEVIRAPDAIVNGSNGRQERFSGLAVSLFSKAGTQFSVQTISRESVGGEAEKRLVPTGAVLFRFLERTERNLNGRVLSRSCVASIYLSENPNDYDVRMAIYNNRQHIVAPATEFLYRGPEGSEPIRMFESVEKEMPF